MWLYDLPIVVGMPLFAMLVVGGSCLVLLALRGWVRRAADGEGEWDRVLGYAVGAYGIFYGVTLGLIAAGAYGNFAEVDGVVLKESSTVAVMYRSAAQFPEPTSTQLKERLVDYTRKVIAEDWPLQQKLITPQGTDAEVGLIQDTITAFAPANTQEATLQAQTMSVFNSFVADRRERIALTHHALPGMLWVVLGVGALLNAVLIGLIEARSLRMHLLMTSMIALFVALLLYAIAGFDHAYAGPITVEPTYFEDLLNGLLSESP